MIKILFPCLNKLDNSLKCDDTNCIFNSQGEEKRCEYFDDEKECHLYIAENNIKDCLCHMQKTEKE